MESLVDLILIKDRTLKRNDVQTILSVMTNVIKENLEAGKDVLWVDLCTFTYKRKPKTQKEAKEFLVNPELARDSQVRMIPADGLEGLSASGGIVKRKKKVETTGE